MAKPKRFRDNSTAPIIAFDFDGTICMGDSFPHCNGELRPYTKEVINFLTAVGMNVVLYTSRDIAINQDTYAVHDDITPMIQFMDRHGINYSAINKSVQFAPFAYNSRKIYAHMYVDDRGYGWTESEMVMIYLLDDILERMLEIDEEHAGKITAAIANGKEIEEEEIEYYKNYIREFWI